MSSAKPEVAAPKPKQKSVATHLLAGGIAGSAEALICHPLDTIKVRLQLRGERASKFPGSAASAQVPLRPAGFLSSFGPNSFIGVGARIVQNEGFFALYKGLGAVMTGIIPKIGIRFTSFEQYKQLLADKNGKTNTGGIFLAGLGAGITESVLVVTPMDVIKIRLQAQRNSMMDPLDVPKYKNALHCALVMIREEGVGSLYKGLGLTALRQATNQGVNFTVYQFIKKNLTEMQPDRNGNLPQYQTLLAGIVSGACGPLFNNPIDTIKTRIQKNPSNEKGWQRFVNVTAGIYRNEGWRAFYKGVIPRVLRVAPGQGISFMVYESAYRWLTEAGALWSTENVTALAASKH
ncbi:mitochondrial carrier domain-containing protein [Polychytrium aggregatum]|uniref:mitochondrial carrier domain-containing protein n=1 Tax=Polychytrium aggregatum TaxID=110093 RepID=UPI0022FDBC8B|nr:mitochondrial carrier domain-containing protein [Polychytrium aggregatum]KAI9203761.1 mitochondrial carrier domain-containing protein [Polychytrium aggregatum]